VQPGRREARSILGRRIPEPVTDDAPILSIRAISHEDVAGPPLAKRCRVLRQTTLTFVLLLGAPAAAQERGRSIDVRQAVALAAHNNPKLAAAGVDVTIADANVISAAGVDDFLWDASAAWNRSRLEYVPGTPVQQTKGDDVLLSTSLTRLLPTGGTVGLRLSTDVARGEYVSDFGSGPQTSTATYQAPSVQLFAAHPLLRGVGERVARAQRHRAVVARSVAGLERDATAATVVRDVVVAYWDTLEASEERGILDALAESARQQLEAVQAAISVEKQPPSASAEVKVAVALRQDAAIAAEQTLRAQSAELSRLLGVDADPGVAPWNMTDTADVVPTGASFDAALASAMDHNPHLAAIRERGRSAAIDVDVRRNGTLPELDLAVSGGTLGNAIDAGSAFAQLGTFHTYNMQIALIAQEPIGRHAARGALQAASEELHKTKLVETDVAAQIRSAVVREVGVIDGAARRIAALADAIDAATLDLAAERARFEVGRATNFDVLRRQQELAETRLRLLRARIDYLEATTAIEALTGDILPHYGVVVR